MTEYAVCPRCNDEILPEDDAILGPHGEHLIHERCDAGDEYRTLDQF